MKTKRTIAWVFGILLGAYFLLVMLPNGRVAPRLAFGWWAFLHRNLSQATWNGNLLVTGGICSVFVVVVGNWLLGHLFTEVQRSRDIHPPIQPWRWRWTLSLYVAVWLLFAIAVGATGVFRQTTWLLEDDRPMFKPRTNYMELSMVSVTLQVLMEENDREIKATRKAFLAEPSLTDKFNVIFYAGPGSKVAACVIIPREPQLLSAGQFAVVTPDGDRVPYRLSELQRTISDLDARYSNGK